MAVTFINNVAYGLSEPLINVPLMPIIAQRAPTTRDHYPLGTIWIFKPQNIAYVITSVVNNDASWVNISQSPGDLVRYQVSTADATVTPIATFALAASSSISIVANFSAAQDDFTHASGGIAEGTVRRAAAGGAMLVGAQTFAQEDDFGGGGVTFDIIAQGNNAVIQVTGIAATVINWTTDVTTIITT